MKPILITYTSHSGSTREIAGFLADELSGKGQQVDVQPISKVTDISSYDRIIAGGLLYRFGWHPEIAGFLNEHQVSLQHKKVALFVTGLRLVKTPECDQAPYPVFIDPSILPDNPERKNWLDGVTTIQGYLNRSLSTLEKIQPVSLAFFAGKLDLHTLKTPEKLIMVLLMLLTGKKPGDYRNWTSIKAWVNSLDLFEEETSELIHEHSAYLH